MSNIPTFPANTNQPGSGGGAGCNFNDPAPSALRIVRLAAAPGDGNITPLSGAKTLDTASTADGDRVLLAFQTTKSENGVWVVSHSGAWTRPADWTADGQVASRTAVAVTDGQVMRYSTWVVVTNGAIHIGTTFVEMRPSSVDFNPVAGPLGLGTYANIGLQTLQIFNSSNGAGTNLCLFLGAFAGTVTRFESPGDGIWMGGVGYKALSDTGGWVALHGGQGKPTGVPNNLNVGAQPGQVAIRFDVTNKKWYGFDTETGSSWKCYGEAFTALQRGANLADANQTIQPFTDKASRYERVIPLTANRNTTLGVTSIVAGMRIALVREDNAAFTNAIINGGGGGGTLFTFPASQPNVRAWFKSNAAATDWTFDSFEYAEA